MFRRPLAQRPLQPSANKRPHSPDPQNDIIAPLKRIKSTSLPHDPARDKTREKRHLEREQQKAEFKEKYTRAFPGFTFYFEDGTIHSTILSKYEEMIEALGARAVQFFDTQVTHFISNRPIPTVSTSTANDKENDPKPLSRGLLRSPIRLKGCFADDTERSHGIDPLLTAVNLDKKVWNTAKLDSVLERLLDIPAPSASSRNLVSKKPAATLARLLKSESIHGTTERDPTQKRHDFKYFSKGSRFVLLEDLRQELATIAVHEYVVIRTRETAAQRDPWPILHCHPQSRGPFIPFDEKEKRRWEKQQRADANKAKREKPSPNSVQFNRKTAEAKMLAKRTGDLRRSVSMNNLRRQAGLHAEDDCIVHDGEIQESANASGFFASGVYIAASGNSVGITSTTGTTSTAGYKTRSTQLPSALTGRMKQHIVTSLKLSNPLDKDNKVLPLAPPAISGRQPILRKSKSTSTFKVPTREEGSKPGYCESCRQKFDDFKSHIQSRKHQRFATNDANFVHLDTVLARVRRRTKHEVREEGMRREESRKFYCARPRADERFSDGLMEVKQVYDADTPGRQL